MSILASFGFLSLCGVKFVDICGVMPFLVLGKLLRLRVHKICRIVCPIFVNFVFNEGVGVDDMFILMSGWRLTDIKLSVEERIAETFR